MTADQIGQEAFGSSFRSAKVEQGVAEFVYGPKQEGDTDTNFRRAILSGSRAIPAALMDKGVTKVRLVAVDVARPDEKLVVFSMTRAESGKLDWSRSMPASAVVSRAKLEYVAPQYQEVAKSTIP